MPLKSGLSHAGAAVSGLALSAVVDSYVALYAGEIARSIRAIGVVLAGATGLPIPPETSGLAVVVAAIAFVWGVAYHYGRSGP